MLQRVQTLYLGIAMILLTIVTIGATLFSFVGKTSKYTFNSFGISESRLSDGAIVEHTSMPFFVGMIALILLCFLCIMSYKNLDRQLKLGRTIFFLYLVSVIAMVILSIVGDSFIEEENLSREMGLGFILFVAGFPFTFLANVGIKRDKRLLDSLDRLR